MKNKKLLVFAMYDEANSILENANKKEQLNLNPDIYKISINRKEYYVVITKVGIIESMYNLLEAINITNPSNIINMGFVGAKGYNVGDIIEVNEVFFKDSDLTIFNYEKYEVPNIGKSILLNNKSNYVKGQLFTSSAFVTSDDILKDKYLCDMEGFGIAYIANKKNISIRIIKLVSDVINHSEQKEIYEKSAGELDSKFLDILEYL